MSGEILLEIKNLSARYVVGSSSIKVLRSVNLKITRGEKIVVVGESGSGKSTLASLIVRLEPDNLVLDSGTALYKFNGQYIDLLKADDKLLSKIRGKEISMVFQNPSTSLNPVYTIGFQVSEALKLEKLAKGQLQEKIGGLLKTVKLPDPLRIARSYPHQLSGGQKQRAMIAIAISRTPKLIITDEPTSSLDVSVQAEILDLLRDINKRGSSIMMITHDIGVAYDFADLVVVMYGGMIVEIGRPGEIVESPYHPYTKYLVNSIPRGTKLSLESTSNELDKNPAIIPFNGCPFHIVCPSCVKGLCDIKEPSPLRLDDRVVACHRVGVKNYGGN